jgi:hypothetical protein
LRENVGTDSDGDWNRKYSGEISNGMDKQQRNFQEIYLTYLRDVQKHMNSDEFSPLSIAEKGNGLENGRPNRFMKLG